MSAEEFVFWEKNHFDSNFYWTCWAVKESLYKLNMKLNGPFSSIFTQMPSQLNLHYQMNSIFSYSIKIKEEFYYVKVTKMKKYILAISSSIPILNNLNHLLAVNATSDSQSKLIRDLVNQNYPNKVLGFKNWKNRAKYPVFQFEGKDCDNLDISLSHDGCYVSACILKDLN
jgi:phosphopantetheinyl transferase (holo-ACP synthase)